MLDKRYAKNTAKKLGLHISRGFLIGTRSRDVISGFAIDAPPRSIYIWTFILPVFDEISVLHMSLGERVAELSTLEGSLEQIMAAHRRYMAPIRTADQLIAYIEFKKFTGWYAQWTKFLCLVRVGHFDQAEKLLPDFNEYSEWEPMARRLVKVHAARSSKGWPGVQDLLEAWSQTTAKLLTKVPAEL